MEPKSTTPPPPVPVLGAPVGYPPPGVYPGAAAAGYPHAPQLYAPAPPPPAVTAASQQAAAQQQLQQLQVFWADQYREIEATTDFKNHNLPLARIKKIMKADEDVRMIAAEAPVVFARACEMFILELTHRGWAHAEENKRRTLQKSDIAAAIARTEVFDFLVDIVPRDEAKDAEAAVAAGMPHPAADALGYSYYVPQQ
jgi:histone H3/H4